MPVHAVEPQNRVQQLALEEFGKSSPLRELGGVPARPAAATVGGEARGGPEVRSRPAWGHFFFLLFLSFFDFFDFFAMVGLPPTPTASRPASRANGLPPRAAAGDSLAADR